MTVLDSPWLNPDAVVEHIDLDAQSWIDVVRGLLVGRAAGAETGTETGAETGAGNVDTVYDDLVRDVAWEQKSNFRYERHVPEPRLSSYQSGAERHPALVAVQDWISARYHVRFDGLSLAQYRDGRDGVGWHRDREMRWLDDTLIGVLTLGATRPFLVAPLDRQARTGGRSRIARDHGADAPDAGTTLDLQPAAGDLLVMGGRCQADWLHAVPQISVACRPRISAQWRWTSRTGRRDPNPSYFAPRRFSR